MAASWTARVSAAQRAVRDVVHQRVGHVGLHHRLVVREVLGPHRVADVAAGPDGGERLGPEELQRLGLNGQGEEGRGEDERPHVAGALLREAGTDQAAQAVPEQHHRLAGLPAAHLVQEDRGVVEIVVEPPDLPARAGRLAVPAQVVRRTPRSRARPCPPRTRCGGRRGRRTRGRGRSTAAGSAELSRSGPAGSHACRCRRSPAPMNWSEVCRRSDGRGAHDVRS